MRRIVPTAPGGAADSMTRLFALQLSERWAQQVMVDAPAGANGSLGAALLAHAQPDGYTRMMGTIGALAINKSTCTK